MCLFFSTGDFKYFGWLMICPFSSPCSFIHLRVKLLSTPSDAVALPSDEEDYYLKRIQGKLT